MNINVESFLKLILAAGTELTPLPVIPRHSHVWQEIGILTIIGIIIISIIFFLTRILYDPSKKRHKRRLSSSNRTKADEKPEPSNQIKSDPQSYSTNSHHKRRKRYPTLAETGGLPPKRSDAINNSNSSKSSFQSSEKIDPSLLP